MAATRIEIDPDLQARLRFLYEQTATPVDDLVAMSGVSRSTFFARVKEWRWARRLEQVPRLRDLVAAGGVEPRATETVSPAPDGAPAAAGEAPLDAAAIAEQVARTIERELTLIDTILKRLGDGADRAAHSERAARTLASLTRSLNEVRRLRMAQAPATPVPAAQDDDDDMPRDIDEFRRELARRIDAFVASRTDPAVSGDDL